MKVSIKRLIGFCIIYKIPEPVQEAIVTKDTAYIRTKKKLYTYRNNDSGQLGISVDYSYAESHCDFDEDCALNMDAVIAKAVIRVRKASWLLWFIIHHVTFLFSINPLHRHIHI